MQVKPEEVRSLIYEDVHEKKQRLAMAREFDKIKDNARIDNFLAGTSISPEKRAQQTPLRQGSRQEPALDDMPKVATPAAFETTGLLPKSSPPANGQGATPDSAARRSGAVSPARQ